MSSPSSTAQSAKPYFAPIDGLRSLCVLLVMCNHLKSDWHGRAYFDGYLGVDIFFVISGFLISTLLLREENLAGKVDVSAFYLRRIFRIIPVYSVVLGTYIAICQLPSQAWRWVQLKAGLPYFLSFMNEFAKEPNGGTVFTHTWSLGVEEKFYVFWPVLFFVAARTLPARILVLIVLFVGSILGFFLGSELFYFYFELLLGCLMAVLLFHGGSSEFTRMLRPIPSPIMLLLYASAFPLEQWNHRFKPLFSVLTVLFLIYLIVRRTWLSRLLSSPLLVWLGKRSYSMYLVHILCSNALEDRIRIESGAGYLALLLAAYALTAAVAALLYVAVEEPARRAGKRLIATLQRPLKRAPELT